MDQSLLPNIYDFVSHCYPFSMLSTFERDILATAVKITYHAKDEVMQDEALTGAGLFMIRTGSAEQINKDGTLRARLGVGDAFGFSQLNKEGKSDYKVLFLENSLLYVVSKRMLTYIIDKNPKVAEYFDSKDWVRLSSAHQYIDDSSSAGSSWLNGKVSDVCQREVPVLKPEDTVQKAAQQLGSTDSDLAVIADKDGLCGIVTKSDLALRVVARALPVTIPVQQVMSPHPVVIEADKPLYAAIEQMLSHNVKNLPVIAQGKIAGCLSTRDLLQNSGLQALFLIKSITKQHNADKLPPLSTQKAEIFRTLVELNVQPRTVSQVLTRVADTFCRQLCIIATEKFGPAPCNFAFFAAGSQARGEMQLMSDQDNGLVYDRELTEQEHSYFTRFADFVNTYLDKCGYPLCTGHYMASNPKWCQSYQAWEQEYARWMTDIEAQGQLDISVFLDLRCLYGDEFLVQKLRQFCVQQAAGNKRFLAQLTASSLSVSPPLGMFRQFVLTRDGENKPSLNIKQQGVNLIAELARIYALDKGSLALNTYDRLQEGLSEQDSGRELAEAFTFLNQVRFSHQVQAMQQHKKLSNLLPPEELSQFERNHLKDAFRIIAKAQNAASFRFKGGL